MKTSGALLKHKNFYHIKKISEEIIVFGNIKIKKRKFHHWNDVILFGDVNIKKKNGKKL